MSAHSERIEVEQSLFAGTLAGRVPTIDEVRRIRASLLKSFPFSSAYLKQRDAGGEYREEMRQLEALVMGHTTIGSLSLSALSALRDQLTQDGPLTSAGLAEINQLIVAKGGAHA